MRHLKSILLALLVTVAVLAAIGFFLSPDYSFRKSVIIHASAQKIFPLVGNLHEWPNWTAWNKQRYTSLKLHYGGPETGPGSWQRWEAEDNEEGEVKVTGFTPPRKLNFDLALEKDFVCQGTIQLEPHPEGTKVVWIMRGNVGGNLVRRFYILFIDKFMSHDLETGLANLKKICEKETL